MNPKLLSGSGATGRAIYSSVQAEIIERVRLRDNALVLYLGSTSTIFGLALGQITKQEILLVLPFLALGVSAIISHHHSNIGAAMLFVENEIEPFLKNIGEDAPVWETSPTRQLYAKRDVNLRFLANLTLISIPPIAGLIFTYKLGLYSAFPLKSFWWIGLLITLITIYLIIEAHVYRNKLQSKKYINNNSKPKG